MARGVKKVGQHCPIASERVFNTSDNTVNARRNTLTAENLDIFCDQKIVAITLVMFDTGFVRKVRSALLQRVFQFGSNLKEFATERTIT